MDSYNIKAVLLETGNFDHLGSGEKRTLKKAASQSV